MPSHPVNESGSGGHGAPGGHGGSHPRVTWQQAIRWANAHEGALPGAYPRELVEAGKLSSAPLTAAEKNTFRTTTLGGGSSNYQPDPKLFAGHYPFANAASSGGGGGGGGNAGGGAAAGGGGNSVVAQVVAFFRQKGLPDYQIAGILGNMRVESNFDTGAYNQGEGAIGLVQWEGGRDDALHSFCAQNGLNPNSVQGQCAFIWHEWHTSESGAFAAFRQTRNAADAAAIFDAQYERSAGTTRQQRINSANAFFNSNLTGDGGSLGAGSSTGGVGGAVGGGGDASVASTAKTADDYDTLGLGNLLSKIPALKKILNQAIAGQWSVARFENAIQNSQWWKTHSDTARAAYIKSANDPAAWQQDISQAKNAVQSLANQLGFSLTSSQLQNIAVHSLLTGNTGNQSWIAVEIGKRQDYDDVESGEGLRGQMGQAYGQLQELAKAYGLQWSPTTLARAAQNVALAGLGGAGGKDMNFYKQYFIQTAKSKYPGLMDQLDAGLTVQDIADPYIQTYAQVLEMNPTSVTLQTPLIQQALQGRASGQSTIPSVMPLYEFERQVRADPRWGYTNNAKGSVGTILAQLGSDFGFGGL